MLVIEISFLLTVSMDGMVSSKSFSILLRVGELALESNSFTEVARGTSEFLRLILKGLTLLGLV